MNQSLVLTSPPDFFYMRDLILEEDYCYCYCCIKLSLGILGWVGVVGVGLGFHLEDYFTKVICRAPRGGRCLDDGELGGLFGL